MAFRTRRDDERQGRDGGRLGDLASAGEPLFVRRLQLVPEAPGAGRFLGRRVLGPGAVAANSDPPEVGHNHLGCRRHKAEERRHLFRGGKSIFTFCTLKKYTLVKVSTDAISLLE